MAIEDILSDLEKFTPYELSRLLVAVSSLLKNDSRLQRIRNSLKPGMHTSFFSRRENRVVPVTVKSVGKTKALLTRDDDKTSWFVPMEYINLDNLDIKTPPVTHKKGSVTKYDLKVGDTVGFDLRGQEVFGVVKKLNPTRAKIVITSGAVWKVCYSSLFPVCEGEHGEPVHYIEGQVVDV